MCFEHVANLVQISSTNFSIFQIKIKPSYVHLYLGIFKLGLLLNKPLQYIINRFKKSFTEVVWLRKSVETRILSKNLDIISGKRNRFWWLHLMEVAGHTGVYKQQWLNNIVCKLLLDGFENRIIPSTNN